MMTFFQGIGSGGKRKSNDSDVDYDLKDAKKLKRKKRKRKSNRKTNPRRSKGESRSSQRIDAVKVANLKTKHKNNHLKVKPGVRNEYIL